MEKYKFYSIVAVGVLSLFGLWFFLHPNSPWHSRNHYLIAFKEIGGLKEGDAVNVGGLPKGYVEELDLTDSCVWVRVAVLSDIKIPVDSRMRLVNVGLMGKRAVEMELGSSNSYHANEASIMGFFDIGSTSIGILTMDAINEITGIINVFSDVIDSLFSEDNMKDYKRIGKKGEMLGQRISRVANSAGNSLENLMDSLTIAKDKVSDIIDHLKTDFDKTATNIDLAINNLDNLGKSLDALKLSLQKVINELEKKSGNIDIIKQEMKKISEDAELLMKQINARGLDLNADIL